MDASHLLLRALVLQRSQSRLKRQATAKASHCIFLTPEPPLAVDFCRFSCLLFISSSSKLGKCCRTASTSRRYSLRSRSSSCSLSVAHVLWSVSFLKISVLFSKPTRAYAKQTRNAHSRAAFLKARKLPLWEASNVPERRPLALGRATAKLPRSSLLLSPWQARSAG